MGGSHGKRGCWIVILSVLTSVAWAQRAPKSTLRHSVATSEEGTPGPTSGRLLTADEGLAIIGAALDARFHLHAGGDCSHLVHEIYQQAGFAYPYAPSTELYDGLASFQRVTNPRPGDLAVWRGHAAIVVNPAQHSFFSATSKGLRVEYYDSVYWKNRGPVRFFRYVKTRSPVVRSVRRTTPADPTESVEAQNPRVAEEESGQAPIDDGASPTAPVATGLAHIMVVHASQPKTRALNEALSQNLDETQRALRDQEVPSLPDPVVVFNRIDVKGVHLKGRQGWADVQIDGFSSLTHGRLTPQKRSERQRWVLTRRDAESWELLLPQQTTYLSHDQAVRILAHRLATLADRTPANGDPSPDEAQLVRTLNVLLGK